MSLVLNTNISSLQAQNNLTKSGSELSTATEDLSSGLQINSAADNAAGFAIATRFQTQIGGLSQASQNASDAINLSQTAGSALDQVTSNLQSIRDLAVQAANGTYQSSDRAAINTEVQQSLSEITRIANQTSFNGTNVLNGSVNSLSFQIGSNVGQAINVQLGQGVTASQVGQISEVSTGNISGAFVTSGGAATGGTLSLSGLSITGADGTAYTFTGGTAGSAQDVADAINAADVNGVSAAVSDNGGINIYSQGSLSVNGAAVTGSASAAASGFTTFTTAATGTGTTAGVYGSGAYTDGASLAAGGSLAGSDVLTVDDANQLISRIDAALTSVSTFSSTLGAIQNRFQSAISTLGAQQTNLTASQSSIQDTNFAAETATLSQAQVLQQAGISVLATANSEPQNILKLLQ
jgi:flagellin